MIRKIILILSLIIQLHNFTAAGNQTQALQTEYQIMELYAQTGFICAEEAGNINMMNAGLLSEAVNARGTDREADLFTIDEYANLKYYHLFFHKDSIPTAGTAPMIRSGSVWAHYRMNASRRSVNMYPCSDIRTVLF